MGEWTRPSAIPTTRAVVKNLSHLITRQCRVVRWKGIAPSTAPSTKITRLTTMTRTLSRPKTSPSTAVKIHHLSQFHKGVFRTTLTPLVRTLQTAWKPALLPRGEQQRRLHQWEKINTSQTTHNTRLLTWMRVVVGPFAWPLRHSWKKRSCQVGSSLVNGSDYTSRPWTT